MATVTVSEKGQLVIPAEVRRRLGITAGTRLEVVEEGPSIRLVVVRPKPETRHADGFGMLVYRGEPRRLADFDVAAAMRHESGR